MRLVLVGIGRLVSLVEAWGLETGPRLFRDVGCCESVFSEVENRKCRCGNCWWRLLGNDGIEQGLRQKSVNSMLVID